MFMKDETLQDALGFIEELFAHLETAREELPRDIDTVDEMTKQEMEEAASMLDEINMLLMSRQSRSLTALENQFERCAEANDS